jgi:hypothetical protein
MSGMSEKGMIFVLMRLQVKSGALFVLETAELRVV